MVKRVRRLLDVRAGEGLPVLLTFLYIWIVVASFVLAKPIRSGLFLGEHEAYDLVYVYAAVPLVLSLFVPLYTRVAARFGARSVTIATLIGFSANVVVFWYLFRFRPFALLPHVFFVWVSCYGVIAPVQAWSFANSLFDTRQAKRLFGLVGAGASLGAMTAGALARLLVGPVGGAVNLLLVLALLIAVAAAIVLAAKLTIRRTAAGRGGRPISRPFSRTWHQIAATPYLRLLAGIVFTVAIATQWTSLQLGVVAKRHFAANASEITEFYGAFSFFTGLISFVLQLAVTGRLLRTWGVSAAVLLLPLALATGNMLILLAPVFFTVLLTYGLDQGLRFSIDKAGYELLYLPISPGDRGSVKNAIDIVISRIADGAGAVLLGLATKGFFALPGLNLDVRGIAALNLVTVSVWLGLAWRVRLEYIRTIQDSIRRHRLDVERGTAAVNERAAAEVLAGKLAADDLSEVRYALDLIEGQQSRRWLPALRLLLEHEDADVRRRALALLNAAGDEQVTDRIRQMLRDPEIKVRTEALLFLSRHSGIDPLRQMQELGDVEDFSIRAGTAAFLAAPGPAQNLPAARLIIEAMAGAPGADGRRDRAEAARLIGDLQEGDYTDVLRRLVMDGDAEVAREALRASHGADAETIAPAIMPALARADVADEAIEALARFGSAVVPAITRALRDETVPAEVRRELPAVLLRIRTPEAEQALASNLLEADGTVRHRVIASLNKLSALRPGVEIDRPVLELLLAAEIAGHYRSYQVLGPLRGRLRDDDPVMQALAGTMEQELERIFRLMALLHPHAGLHDAYVGVRSPNAVVRANALEFLENVLRPELRQVVVPLLDAQVTVQERIELANRMVGAPLDSPHQAVATLIASEDPWLRSCAIQAIGTLQLRELAPELERHEGSADALVREAVASARARLDGEERQGVEQPHPAPPDLDVGVGAG